MINTVSLFALPVIIVVILTMGIVKKVSVYEEFIEGAKDGFKVSVSIIPYLAAIIVGISMFHASGAMDCLGSCLSPILERFAVPPEALPVMITRSLSGSATLGLFSDIVHRLGANSYAAKLCAVIAGSSETTFYVLAVYFGAVGINKYRYALVVGLIADAIGIFAAILVCRSVFLPSIG